MFKCEIDTRNSAFDDGDGGRHEIARILREVEKQMQFGRATEGNLYDINGNRVGSFKLTTRRAGKEG